MILTDIIIALSLSELLSQGEGSKTLEFLREFLRSVRCKRPRALPAELVKGVRLADFVVLLLHHVEHIALSCMWWHLAVGVVGADDVQIVINTHFHCVLIPQKAAGRQRKEEINDTFFICSFPLVKITLYRHTQHSMWAKHPMEYSQIC